MLKIKLITPPAVEPVSLLEIKTQLQIDPSDTIYDDQINALLPAAREWCESYQNRAYITQSFELALDDFPCKPMVRLPRPPLQSISSVHYKNHEGISTTWPTTSYGDDTFSEPGNLVRLTDWPKTNRAVNNVIITYTAGYGEPENVPVTIKQAIILLVVHWFNNGLCDPPNAVYALLDLERVIPV